MSRAWSNFQDIHVILFRGYYFRWWINSGDLLEAKYAIEEWKLQSGFDPDCFTASNESATLVQNVGPHLKSKFYDT